MRRVIWIILDSVGMGELPDAAEFNDEGANTLGHIWEYSGGINIPNMIKLGLGNIDGMKFITPCDKPMGAFLRSAEQSRGKDTTVGHWEMTGIVSKNPFPVYPDGFPKDIIEEFINRTGVPGILGNCVASGTTIIKELGSEHIRTGKPIVYTSADSVFQIAACTDVISLEKLYEMCQTARKILRGDNEVARVIARPFIIKDNEYVRTSDRRDYAILPPENNLLNIISKSGMQVAAVGKIEDIFAGSGITKSIHTKNNMDGVDKTLDFMKEDFKGLIFTNLVEFDSSWGHRRDIAGYKKGLEDFDARLPKLMEAMNEDDILIINSDHGCDPSFKGTDHTREYIPILVYGKTIKPGNLGTRKCFADIGQTISEYLGCQAIDAGKSFLTEMEKNAYENG